MRENAEPLCECDAEERQPCKAFRMRFSHQTAGDDTLPHRFSQRKGEDQA